MVASGSAEQNMIGTASHHAFEMDRLIGRGERALHAPSDP
jgi:hypothetical protein